MAETDEPASPESSARPNRPGPEALYGVKDLTEDTAQKLLSAMDRSYPIKRLRSSQIATGIVGTLGLALFLVGLENAVADIPIIDNGWASMLLGLVLLAAAGVLIRRFME
jgi:hypothetical protein